MGGNETVNSTPVAGMQQPASPVPGIIDLAKYVGGQKQISMGGETGVVRGQTGPLEALLATISDPNNLANLVANLFAQGAAQVPGLTTQFANATGSRVTNNSMLSQSLAQLNQTLAQSIAEAVQKQQATAVGAAGKLAETNKDTNQTARKEQTATPNSLSKAVGGGAGSIVAGTLLNKLGKMMPTSSPNSTPNAGPDVTNMNLPSVNIPEFALTPGGPSGSTASVDATGFAGNTDYAAIGDQIVAGGDANTSGGDVTSSGDASTGAAAADTVSSADDASSLWDIGESWFEDGGLIHIVLNPRNQGYAPGGQLPGLPGAGYADGGMVADPKYADGGPITLRRNVPNMGATGSVAGTPVMTAPFSPLPMLQRASGKPMMGTEIKENGLPDASGAGNDAGGTASASTAPAAAPGAAPPAGLALGLALGPTPVGLGITLAQIIANSLAGNNNDAPPPAGPGPVSFGDDDPPPPGENPDGLGEDGTGENPGPATSPPSGGPPPTGDDTPGGNPPGSSPDGGSPAGGSTTGGDSSSDGSGTSGDMADGGRVKAKSKFDLGTDNVRLRATPGEFMLPVSTADYIGRELLDDLVALTHSPTSGR